MERNAGLAQRTAFAAPVVPWTRESVVARLREAMGVVRRLPNRELRWVRGGAGTYWPEILYNRDDRSDQEARRNDTYVRPGGAALDAADAALGWVLWLDEYSRGLVLARCAGLGLRPLCKRLGIHRETARRRFNAAAQDIADRLNAG